MLFFYIRHGDPIYRPDSLTPLGERQAEALAKRLALYGLDRIFSSSSNRAILTAKPTCELLGKEAEIVDFANEGYAWDGFTVKRGETFYWRFDDPLTKQLFTDESVLSMGHDWCEHPEFTGCKEGMERVWRESFEFFRSLGYERIGKTGKYKVLQSNNERVALFAHQGFGSAFMSALLGIPYPQYSVHFDMSHTGMTVIDFREKDGFAIPRVLTLSSDSHLYREGLSTRYNHDLYF